MTEISFKIAGAYQFTEAFTVHCAEPFIHADAGRIAGAWRWTFGDGTSGSCHINGATANRITPNGASLFGTMKIDMFEVTGDASRTDMLYLSYESSSFWVEGTTVDIVVEGTFVGGSGKYAGAQGCLRVRSVNGYIGEGEGTLILDGPVDALAPSKPDTEPMSEAATRAAVDAYFSATQSGDPAVWTARFAESPFVEDPVGQPPLTTAAAIQSQGEQFMSNFESVGLYPSFVQVSGNRATAKWTGRGVNKAGESVEFEGINVFTFAADGRVKRLLGYWNPATIKVIDIT